MAEAAFDRALALFRAGRVADLIALADGPAASDPAVLNIAAAGAAAAGDDAGAERLYRAALALDPGFGSAQSNFAVFLQGRRRWAEAEALLSQALDARPAFTSARLNLANLMARRGRFDAALDHHRAAVEHEPANPEARFRLACALMAEGRYAEGWPLFEARHDAGREEARPPPAFAYPPWRGEPLAGRSVLAWFEQGLGDQIQFNRFVPRLKALGAAQVTLVCPPALAGLFAGLAGVDRLVPAAGSVDIPHHDFWVLPMSLPLALGAERPDQFWDGAYLAPPERAVPLGEGAGARVGLVWKGGAALANDANRSLPNLGALAPLWRVPGVRFFSLQKGQGEAEAATPPPGQPLRDLAPSLGDFADTAAALRDLDLLISVDTAPARLAGALGRPCWTLLPSEGLDWRWGRSGETTPWYPSMRLFRQARGEAWADVAARVAQALKAFV